jgi:phage gp45-like
MSTEILRGLVKLADDAPGTLTVQVEDVIADDPDDELEMLEPVGVHFLPSLDEDVLVVEVNGSADNRVVLCASQRGHRPQDLTAAGTGGLHYLGAWKVFLDDDGTVHLGERDAGDFVALASLVKAELDAIKADFDAFKTTFDGHTHLYSPGPSPSAPSAPPASPAPAPHTPGGVASEVVKAV